MNLRTTSGQMRPASRRFAAISLTWNPGLLACPTPSLPPNNQTTAARQRRKTAGEKRLARLIACLGHTRRNAQRPPLAAATSALRRFLTFCRALRSLATLARTAAPNLYALATFVSFTRRATACNATLRLNQLLTRCGARRGPVATPTNKHYSTSRTKFTHLQRQSKSNFKHPKQPLTVRGVIAGSPGPLSLPFLIHRPLRHPVN